MQSNGNREVLVPRKWNSCSDGRAFRGRGCFPRALVALAASGAGASSLERFAEFITETLTARENSSRKSSIATSSCCKSHAARSRFRGLGNFAGTT